jgi:KR domain
MLLRVQVKCSILDVVIPAQAQQALTLSAQMAPLGGIFHLAGVLDDWLLTNLVCPNSALLSC